MRPSALLLALACGACGARDGAVPARRFGELAIGRRIVDAPPEARRSHRGLLRYEVALRAAGSWISSVSCHAPTPDGLLDGCTVTLRPEAVSEARVLALATWLEAAHPDLAGTQKTLTETSGVVNPNDTIELVRGYRFGKHKIPDLVLRTYRTEVLDPHAPGAGRLTGAAIHLCPLQKTDHALCASVLSALVAVADADQPPSR